MQKQKTTYSFTLNLTLMRNADENKIVPQMLTLMNYIFVKTKQTV